MLDKNDGCTLVAAMELQTNESASHESTKCVCESVPLLYVLVVVEDVVVSICWRTFDEVV